ncbi:MAG: hypothetical protein PHT96_03165 [Syntrophorhabdaceae bacterium]|nr:hypothetical protein [Syntrophorhabdaceae bacterium]
MVNFKSGRQAFEYYFKNKDIYTDLECNIMARLMEHNRMGLHDANILPSSTPSWAERLETLIDLERILDRHMTKEEQRTMQRCIERTDNMARYKNFKQYKARANKEKYVFAKFTEVLRNHDYISARDESDWFRIYDDLTMAA